MPRTTSRQKIQEYLNKQHGVSAEQISRALGMKAPNVRHHLSVLLANGRIEFLAQTHLKGRGRPIKVYGPTVKELGDNTGSLSEVLLDEFLAKNPGTKRQPVLQALAKKLSDQMGRIEVDKLSTKRLGNLVEKLNRHHYQARWEAGAEGPRILFGRCPYATIIAKHPELCQMDGYMLEEEGGGKVRQLAKIDPKPGGNINCIFLMR